VPAVLVPFPHAVDDHQSANARYLAEHGAAVLLAQPDATAEAIAWATHEFVLPWSKTSRTNGRRSPGARADTMPRPIGASRWSKRSWR
jgi:UDP-N-acetylglucosamine:LPS N-acetylglucosamine transferase